MAGDGSIPVVFSFAKKLSVVGVTPVAALAAVLLVGLCGAPAVAVDLAQDRELAGVVLESTFTSIADVARTLGGLSGACNAP